MRFINKTTALFLLFTTVVFAQPKKEKVDGVVGVVGEYVILDSDVDLEFIQLKANGIDTKNITRCELFGKLLEDKLYAHQAIQDSIVVTDQEVNDHMNQQIDAMIEQVGSLDKVIKFYKKKDEEETNTECQAAQAEIEKAGLRVPHDQTSPQARLCRPGSICIAAIARFCEVYLSGFRARNSRVTFVASAILRKARTYR